MVQQERHTQHTPPMNELINLRAALAALKAEAISDDGARVDYGALAGGPAYAAYRGLVASLRAADPRIHFALNCAARSCPPIAAYDAARLDAQLDTAARGFVAAGVSFDRARGLLTLSQLLDWYAGDFGGHEGLVRFVAAHLPDDERRRGLLACPEVDLAFTPYDWRLSAAGGR